MSNPSPIGTTPNLFLRFTAHPPTNTTGLAQVQLDDLVVTQVLIDPQTAATYENGVWTLTGRGTGLVANHDQLSFVGRYLSGDQVLQRRVGSMSSDAPTASAGLVMREDDHANAPFVAVLKTGTGEVQMRWRASQGANVQTLNAPGASSTTASLRLARVGNSFTASWSDDGQTWTTIGSQSADIPTQPYLAGMAASSSSATLENTVSFHLCP